MTIEKLLEGSEKVNVAIEKIVTTLQGTNAELLYKKPSDEEWSVMQIVCHVIEAVEFWVADLEALLIVPGAKWGRNHEHVRRLAAVADQQVRSVSIEQASEQLRALIPLVEKAFSKVREEDLNKTAPSYNPNFDGKPLSFLINHLIILHVEGHLAQIERHLQKVKNQS